MTTSWVIVDKKSGKALFETFKPETAEIVRARSKKCKVVPILEFLVNINTQIRRDKAILEDQGEAYGN